MHLCNSILSRLFMFPNSISYLRVHFKLNTQTASGVMEMFSVRVSNLFKGNVILARILNLFNNIIIYLGLD